MCVPTLNPFNITESSKHKYRNSGYDRYDNHLADNSGDWCVCSGSLLHYSGATALLTQERESAATEGIVDTMV